MRGKQLSAYLKALRIGQGLSVRDLGQQAGCTGSYVSQMETGVRPINVNQLWRLISALHGDMGIALTLFAIDAGVPRRAIPFATAYPIQSEGVPQ